MCGLRKTCTSQISWKCLFYNSLINIMEGMWMCQQGHSAAHVQQHLWAKSIFFLRTAQWQSVPSCCWDQASQVAPHVGMPASYASSNKDMMLNGYLHPECVRALMCLLWVGRMRERRRCRNEEEGKKGFGGGDEREWARKEKQERTKEQESRASFLKATKEKVQREGKGRKWKTWTLDLLPFNTHWLMHANARATPLCLCVLFNMLCITWHYCFCTDYITLMRHGFKGKHSD